MTGLGPSLRRLPSGDPKSGPGATGGASDGKPDGSSDAGDSLDGQTSGMAYCYYYRYCHCHCLCRLFGCYSCHVLHAQVHAQTVHSMGSFSRVLDPVYM